MSSLLIVAPAATLTASLRFVLEADGYHVTETKSLAEAAHKTGRFDCTVLDHHVLAQQDEHDIVRFVKSHQPVVLLANDLIHPLSKWTFRTLTKPLLGAALSQAVRDAVALRLN